MNTVSLDLDALNTINGGGLIYLGPGCDLPVPGFPGGATTDPVTPDLIPPYYAG